MAALAEAAGWTILIIGILFEKYIVPGNVVSVPLAGSVHGTLFLIYIAAVVVLSPSQDWSLRQTSIAGIASVPPYGSLVFEQWVAHDRRKLNLKQSVFLLSYRQLVDES